MNLLNLFKKFNAEDLEKENNQLKSVDKISIVIVTGKQNIKIGRAHV